MTTAYRPQEMAVIAGDYNVPLPPLVQIDAASTTLPIEWVKKKMGGDGGQAYHFE